jgi:hypothetical protein
MESERGERVSVHRGGEGQPLDPAHVPGPRRLPLRLPRLGGATAIRSRTHRCLVGRADSTHPPREPAHLWQRVERLMRAHRLSGALRQKRAKTTVRVAGVRAAADLVGRDFAPSASNQLWGGRHQVRPDWGGVAVPRRGRRLLLAPRRGLVDARRSQCAARRRRARDGRRTPEAQARPRPPLRPGLAVRLTDLRRALPRRRH